MGQDSPGRRKKAVYGQRSSGGRHTVTVGRADGATVKELMAATDWLPHSVRGFVSNLARKNGQKIEAVKRETGERAYHLASTGK